jgi:hypothetical protein
MPIPVAIEPKGLLVAKRRAAGVSVYAISPLSVARYRDRYGPRQAKSDAEDELYVALICPRKVGQPLSRKCANHPPCVGEVGPTSAKLITPSHHLSI